MRIVDDALEYMKQEYRTRVEVRHLAHLAHKFSEPV
jgi:hypothetical protein